MEELAVSARIHFEPHVIVSKDSVASVIQSTSQSASLVLLGFETPEAGRELEQFYDLEALAGSLPRVIIVNSAGGMTLES